MRKIGTQIIADFSTQSNLTNLDECIELIDKILKENRVKGLGQVSQRFSTDGFTLSIILAESHINIHTWPEYSLVNLDIFLCNLENDNTEKLNQIYKALEKYFNPDKISKQIIYR